MEVNNIKENLEKKQTYKEIKKSKRQEHKKIKKDKIQKLFSKLNEIFTSGSFKCIAVNTVLTIIIVIVLYSPVLFGPYPVQHDIGIMAKIVIGILSIFGFGLIALTLMFIESRIQNLVITKKLNKMSYKRMQYIPLTKTEFIKLEIHNINDYVIFLNEFLEVRIDYFHFFELLDWYRTKIATPPQMVINKINESLMCLDEIPENGQQIEFHYTDGFVVYNPC